ncbi:hypothetical protein [Nonomuraea sp. WAC 01424]|uniref:hypothetical protein n=1 Tax=Nonomuraea sp. WAC 01424 TaxID=2203200 RepID=UPI0011D06F76|nr:hypothetical protein [Nonomuraea sp. WAC 01424]
MWFIEFNSRRWIPDEATLRASWLWSDVKVLPDAEVAAVPRGPNLTSALHITGGNYGWAVLNGRKTVPGGFGLEGQGAGVALWDVNDSGRPDLIVFHIENPAGENFGRYRIGWNLDAFGVPRDGWSPAKPIPGWFGAEDQGGGVAVWDISGNGRPDLVVFHIDNPGEENTGHYRIGWNLNQQGDPVGGWSSIKSVPGWFGAEDQGADISITDISGNGRPDLVVAHIDNPGGENRAYYRIGWDLDVSGVPQGGWSPIKPIPGWFGAENQGLGITTFHYGAPVLAVAHVDNPDGENRAHVRLTSLDKRGNTIAGWTQPIPLQAPNGLGWETAGVGIAAGYIAGGNRPDLITFYVDAAVGQNGGHYFLAERLVGVP